MIDVPSPPSPPLKVTPKRGEKSFLLSRNPPTPSPYSPILHGRPTTTMEAKGKKESPAPRPQIRKEEEGSFILRLRGHY